MAHSSSSAVRSAAGTALPVGSLESGSVVSASVEAGSSAGSVPAGSVVAAAEDAGSAVSGSVAGAALAGVVAAVLLLDSSSLPQAVASRARAAHADRPRARARVDRMVDVTFQFTMDGTA